MLKRISLGVMAAAYLAAGLHEIVAPASYAASLPPLVPRPALAMVLLGAVKVLLAILLLLPRFRRRAALGLIGLLLLLLPANVYVAWSGGSGLGVPAWALWLRVPLQFLFMAWAWWHAQPDRSAAGVLAPDAGRRAVVITGASTGLGRSCALRLDEAGWRVFAGVRSQRDAEALRAEGSSRLVTVFLDVADADSIAESARAVHEAVGAGGIQGLVNNAGICVAGPSELVALDAFRGQLEVNLVGPLAVAQAYLPLLRRGGGRIVNMGSTGGRIALPFLGPYAASKFGLEGLTDSMRRELRAHGIAVSLIEPGSIVTPIWDKVAGWAHEALAHASPESRAAYEAQLASMLARNAEAAQARSTSPDDVARAVEHALTAARPRIRYRVGADAQVALALVPKLPDRLVDWVAARAFSRGAGESGAGAAAPRGGAAAVSGGDSVARQV